jgi:hypothetical protein
MAITAGFQGAIEYIAESTYGGGLPASGQLEIPSDAVTNVNLDISREVKRHHDIGSASCVETTYHSKAYTLTIDYELQQLNAATQYTASTSLEYYTVTRSSGDLNSLAFVYDTGDGVFLLKGGLVNRYSWNCTQDEAVQVSVEIIGNAVETDTAASNFTNYGDLTSASAIGNSIETYSGASITRSGKWTEGINSFTMEINNNVDRLFEVGESEAASTKPGYTDISGTAVIIASDGGKTPVDDILSGDEVNIVAQSGTTSGASHKFTLSNASYNSIPVVYQTDMTGMLVDANWGAESVAYGAVS